MIFSKLQNKSLSIDLDSLKLSEPKKDIENYQNDLLQSNQTQYHLIEESIMQLKSQLIEENQRMIDTYSKNMNDQKQTTLKFTTSETNKSKNDKKESSVFNEHPNKCKSDESKSNCSAPIEANKKRGKIPKQKTCDCIKDGCTPCNQHGNHILNIEIDLNSLKNKIANIQQDQTNTLQHYPEWITNIENKLTEFKNHQEILNKSIKERREAKNSTTKHLEISENKKKVTFNSTEKVKIFNSNEATSYYHSKGSNITGGLTMTKPITKITIPSDKVKNLDNPMVQGIWKKKYSNTCYMNAAIKMLFDVPDIKKAMEGKDTKLVKIYSELNDFCRNPNSEKLKRNNHAENSKLIEYMRTIDKTFNENKQEDCVNFIEQLVDLLNQEINKDQQDIKKSSLRDIIMTKMAQKQTCNTCTSQKTDSRTMITTTYENARRNGEKSCTLRSLIKDNFDKRTFKDHCRVCRTDWKTSIETKIEPTKYIIIHINTKTFERINTKIETCDKINLTEWSTIKDNQEYQLIGGIAHQGGTTTGHYFYLSSIDTQKWHKIDDDRTSKVENKEAKDTLEQYGTLFLYKRITETCKEDKNKKITSSQFDKYKKN